VAAVPSGLSLTPLQETKKKNTAATVALVSISCCVDGVFVEFAFGISGMSASFTVVA
jgi:hypothetical protein